MVSRKRLWANSNFDNECHTETLETQKVIWLSQEQQTYLVNYEEREQNKPYSQVAETHIDSIINER